MKFILLILALLLTLWLPAIELERDDNRVPLQTAISFSQSSATLAADSTWTAIAVPSGAVHAHMASDNWFAVDPDSTTVNPTYEETYLPVLDYAINSLNIYVYGDSATVIKIRWDKIR